MSNVKFGKVVDGIIWIGERAGILIIGLLTLLVEIGRSVIFGEQH